MTSYRSFPLKSAVLQVHLHPINTQLQLGDRRSETFRNRHSVPRSFLLRNYVLAICVLLFVGCSSPPKDVTEAWQKYEAVKKGMSRDRVHALAGKPNFAHNKQEEWQVGQPFELGAYSASLSVTYGPDGRVLNVDKRLYHHPKPNTKGLAY
jgi:hypothetical protein